MVIKGLFGREFENKIFNDNRVYVMFSDVYLAADSELEF